MPTLFLACKNCGKEFPSGIAVEDRSRGGVAMFNVQHRCPHCGTEAQYSTQDYHVSKESPIDAKTPVAIPETGTNPSE